VDLVSDSFFFFLHLILKYFLDNPCYNSICQNNGFCSANYNSTSVSFTCTCSNLYTGLYCENSIYTILQSSTNCVSTCLNGGTCVNGMCMCTSQYIGPSCQYGK
jgi:hypothetical protein